MICYCFGITETRLRAVIANDDVQTVTDVTRTCRAGGGCGCCRFDIEAILDEHSGNNQSGNARSCV
jgi:NifU-like protein